MRSDEDINSMIKLLEKERKGMKDALSNTYAKGWVDALKWCLEKLFEVKI